MKFVLLPISSTISCICIRVPATLYELCERRSSLVVKPGPSFKARKGEGQGRARVYANFKPELNVILLNVSVMSQCKRNTLYAASQKQHQMCSETQNLAEGWCQSLSDMYVDASVSMKEGCVLS